MNSVSDDKRRLRRLARERRAALDPAGAEARALALRDRLLGACDFPAGCSVSAYWPIKEEADPRPALAALLAAGHPLCLPAVAAKGKPLIFRAWQPGDPLQPGGLGTFVPSPEAPTCRPRVLLVPLLAFDRAGYRLGYGGGFYDRTLTALRNDGGCLAVGLAYAIQEMAELPHDSHDQRLDMVVTEEEAFAIDRGAIDRGMP